MTIWSSVTKCWITGTCGNELNVCTCILYDLVSLSYWKGKNDSPFKSMVLHSKSINPCYDYIKHY